MVVLTLWLRVLVDLVVKLDYCLALYIYVYFLERNTKQQNSVVHQVILKCQQSMTKISSDDQCKLLATLVTHLY